MSDNETREFDPREYLMQIRQSQADLLLERSELARKTLRVNGDPYANKYIERFLNRIQVSENRCWLWTSTLNNKGYARLGMYKRLVLVHRWTYILFKGVIPANLELDHLCRNPRCINPNHLEPVTHQENNLRGNTQSAIHAKKTHCPQGHPYDEENTHIDKRGRRECRVCKREKARTYNELLTLKRTHCPQGHLYDSENTGIRKSGTRYCKKCSSMYSQRFGVNRKEDIA